jgi:uncharacterized protein YndB with AHSA1/START domain
VGHWEFEHSADSKASPASVWDRYTDVDNWSQWSTKGVEESSLDGEFEVGSKGMSKAPHMPKGKFELIEVEPEERFVSKATFPGGTMHFEHILDATDGGTRITHKASLDGPLVFLWSPGFPPASTAWPSSRSKRKRKRRRTRRKTSSARSG